MNLSPEELSVLRIAAAPGPDMDADGLDLLNEQIDSLYARGLLARQHVTDFDRGETYHRFTITDAGRAALRLACN